MTGRDTSRERERPSDVRHHAEGRPVEAVTGRAERALIEGLARGSRLAFVRLLDAHSDAVRGRIARYVDDRADVDDLAQEVFLVAYREIERFQGRSSLRGWLLAIARNRTLAHLRREHRRRESELDLMRERIDGWHAGRLEQSTEIEPAASAEWDADQLRHLRGCIARLGDRQRELVERFYFRGTSAAEIGEELGRSGAAIRMSLLRIRGVLRACVGRRRSGDGPERGAERGLGSNTASER